MVIDALRATTTMTVAFENGCSAFIPVATVEEARELAARNPGFLLAGERGAVALPGFDLGNSPRDFRPEKVKGKVVVMTTTNGTRALVASRRGAEIFIGSFLNLGALTGRLVEAGRDILIACAGKKMCSAWRTRSAGGRSSTAWRRPGSPCPRAMPPPRPRSSSNSVKTTFTDSSL